VWENPLAEVVHRKSEVDAGVPQVALSSTVAAWLASQPVPAEVLAPLEAGGSEKR